MSSEHRGFTLLSVHSQYIKDSLTWESMSRPSLADFWSVFKTDWGNTLGSLMLKCQMCLMLNLCQITGLV